ncbi:glutamine--tRNA ligase/YqeY domain fusion protein [Candidatus Mcinerneyibacteriota bacterium]|nr:glutamine--tRNA ligase/YqeY domain fusion protein [Candidatus Mcinerneyibacteriota bacterium]
MEKEKKEARNFIEAIIDDDLARGKVQQVVTRFPPEPNGYLHIGHAKSICLNFGIAKKYGGRCHLRFDDTNPEKEEQEYIDAICEDVRWLGFDWGSHLYYASDYYEDFYKYAEELIEKGLAYVDDLSAEEIRAYRGTLTEPGRVSPWRDRSPEENMTLFRRMKAGEFKDGEKVLRARIDMSSPNINMRDPVIYRIKHASHPRTKEAWCIYPMYDFAHCISDAIEGITHSVCTLEFEDHRPLYDWFLDHISIENHPRQIEFARLNVTQTVMSKRKLLSFVSEGLVNGWDDPRMPTIAGLRRRGFTPESIRAFAEAVGVAKANSVVDSAMLDYFIRDDLNRRAPRVMAVLRPVKVVIDNYPEDKVEWVEAENNPNDPGAGTRKVPFSREIYIEEEDFMEDPPKKYFRLSPGREVRLKHAYYITCTHVDRDEEGKIREIHCTYDPASRGGWTPDERKVKGTLHWLSAAHAVRAEVRLYEPLIREGEGEFDNLINRDSRETLTDAFVEPGLKGIDSGRHFQFLRLGYFFSDPDSSEEKSVFNRVVGLKDTWAKVSQ